MPTERPQLCILVVEDHADSRFALTRLLQLLGYRVEAAENAARARQLARTHSFDLMLCDLGLPDGNGCDLMRELADVHRMKGVAVTGHGLPNDICAIQEAGFLGHLLKPITIERLTESLRRVMLTWLTPAEIAIDGPGDLPQN